MTSQNTTDQNITTQKETTMTTSNLTTKTTAARKRAHVSVMWTEAQHAAFDAVDYGMNKGGTRRFFEDLLNGTVEMVEAEPDDESGRVKTLSTSPEVHALVKELAAKRGMSVNSLVRNVLFGEEPKPLHKARGLKIQVDEATATLLKEQAAQARVLPHDYARQLLADALASAA